MQLVSQKRFMLEKREVSRKLIQLRYAHALLRCAAWPRFAPIEGDLAEVELEKSGSELRVLGTNHRNNGEGK